VGVWCAPHCGAKAEKPTDRRTLVKLHPLQPPFVLYAYLRWLEYAFLEFPMHLKARHIVADLRNATLSATDHARLGSSRRPPPPTNVFSFGRRGELSPPDS
jgi:hypothetical protein